MGAGTSERDLQKQKDRAEIANQLVRGGMLMNGGGAVALLAFIQASVTLEKLSDLGWWAALSMIPFVLGLGFVSVANFIRIRDSLDDGRDIPGKR